VTETKLNASKQENTLELTLRPTVYSCILRSKNTSYNL